VDCREHYHLRPCPYCEIRRLRRALLMRDVTDEVAQALQAISERAERAELAVAALTAECTYLQAERARLMLERLHDLNRIRKLTRDSRDNPAA
jgi:hypothetical protein